MDFFLAGIAGHRGQNLQTKKCFPDSEDDPVVYPLYCASMLMLMQPWFDLDLQAYHKCA
jgi:hypothetical protein